jgi:ribosomal protein S18 acetylase RimI-like enzyme
MDVTIRPAADTDKAFLLDLNRRAYEDVVRAQFGVWDAAAQDARLAAKLRDAGAGVRIIERAGRSVGAVWSSVHDDFIFLHELILLPEAQGQGLGSQVLGAELEAAQVLGKPIRLHTLRLNRAQAFFRAHGFAVTGADGDYVDMEWSG